VVKSEDIKKIAEIIRHNKEVEIDDDQNKLRMEINKKKERSRPLFFFMIMFQKMFQTKELGGYV
jgi:hypothetical protein